jgi:hypothetical protein
MVVAVYILSRSAPGNSHDSYSAYRQIYAKNEWVWRHTCEEYSLLTHCTCEFGSDVRCGLVRLENILTTDSDGSKKHCLQHRVFTSEKTAVVSAHIFAFVHFDFGGGGAGTAQSV